MITVGKRRGEAGVALVLGVIGLFLILTAARMSLGTAVMPGPGVMPLAIGIGLATTAVALLIAALKRSPEAAGAVQLGSRHILVAAGGLVWTSLLLEKLGFFPCFGIFLLALAKGLGRLGWIKALTFAGVSVAAAYWFFAVLLDVSLPRGLL